MKIYSADLRQRVVAAVQEGAMSQAAIAQAFSVSLSTVENWWRSFRASGSTAPLPHAGGKKRKLQPYRRQIQRAVKPQPDATLLELCALVAAQTGVHASPSMMCRELQSLHLVRKKVSPRLAARHTAHPGAAPSLSPSGAHRLATPRRPSQIRR